MKITDGTAFAVTLQHLLPLATVSSWASSPAFQKCVLSQNCCALQKPRRLVCTALYAILTASTFVASFVWHFLLFPNPRCVSRAFLAGRQGGWSGRRGFRKLSLLRLVFFSHVSRSSGIGVTVDIL